MRKRNVKLKGKLLFEFEYDVDFDYYEEFKNLDIENLTIEDIIKIEKDDAAADPCSFCELGQNRPIIEIEEIKNEEEGESKD